MIASLVGLLGIALFAFVLAAFGHRLLRLMRVELQSDSERLLYSAALGAISYETLLAVLEFSGSVRVAIVVALIAAAACGAHESRAIARSIRNIIRRIANGSRPERWLASACALVVLFEGFVAMAPLTGSDALHYHFLAPLLTLREGFHPNFFLAHSFFTGQGHLLILTGLALGSEQLALGFLFLGGVLAAVACAHLARQWVSREWAWLAALTFLLTPVVFWQAASSGAPDIWMAFFAPLGVLAVARAGQTDYPGWVLLAGILAGALAGAKYTGCIVAASLLVPYIWEARSLKRSLIFVAAALGTGIWPYLRNAIWTGDPVFPFFLRAVAPERVNSYTLAALLSDTGAAAPHSVSQLLSFPVFAAVDQMHLGFWQFFGPLVLIFVPLMIVAVRNAPLWRVALLVWFLSSVGIGILTGMARFLLPVFPIALAATFAGAALWSTRWRIARFVSVASIAAFLVFCAGGLLLYGRSAFAAAVDFTSHEDYLKQRAPDYAKVEFINQTLSSQVGDGKALVFLQHLYYLRVPFVSANPNLSWAIDPQQFDSQEAWIKLFRAQRVRWVVRSDEYPPAIAPPLWRLEQQHVLTPSASGEVSDFDGMRLLGVRKTTPIVILRVND